MSKLGRRLARHIAPLVAALEGAALRRLHTSLRPVAPALPAPLSAATVALCYAHTRFALRWLHQEAPHQPDLLAWLPLSPAIRQWVREVAAPDDALTAWNDAFDADLAGALGEGPPDDTDLLVHLHAHLVGALSVDQHKRHGAVYTPDAVVEGLLHLVDSRLRTDLHLPDGLADTTTWSAYAAVPEGIDPTAPVVQILDPTTGTGAFLLGVLRKVRSTRPADDWPAYVRDHLLPRLHAIERSPSAAIAAHLRVGLALARSGATAAHWPADAPVLRLTITDALAAPDTHPDARGPLLDLPITVVVGNPPYHREAAGSLHGGGWIRDGWKGWRDGHPPLEDYLAPLRRRGGGRHLKSVYNLYAYFWRWASWRVWENGSGIGVVGLVTGASYLRGPGFAGMRQHLLERVSGCDVVDLGGDTRGPRRSDNVFGVSIPVCITTVWRTGPGSASLRILRAGGNTAEKLGTCRALTTDHPDWQPLSSPGAAPWTPRAQHDWPRLVDLFPWQHSGIQFKRTWPIGVSADLLQRRWTALLTDPDRAAAFRPTGARGLDRAPRPLPGHPNGVPLADLSADAPSPVAVPYAYRPFDRQWALLDARLCDRPRPVLVAAHGPRQRYLVSRLTGAFGPGPAALVTAELPDLHHFRGSYGGKDVLPLWRDAAATVANVTPGVLPTLSERLGREVSPHDLFAYTYAVLAQPGFVARVAETFGATGPRLPLAADAALFFEGVLLGSQLVERHIAQPERCSGGPGFPVPRKAHHDPIENSLQVGALTISGVSSALFDFSVSGYPVLQAWLSHRLGGGAGRRMSRLDQLQPRCWLPEWTDELQWLVGTLAWTLHQQTALAEWLERVLAGPLVSTDDLPQPTAGERSAPPHR